MPTESELAPDVHATGSSRRAMLTGMGVVAGAGLAAVAGAQPAHAADTEGGLVYSASPERIIDTREEGGPLKAGQSRLIPLTGLAGWSLFFNLTVVNTVGNGYLSVYDADFSRPAPYSSINWQGSGRVVANFGLVSLGAGGFRVYCGGSGTSTNFIMDIVGFAVESDAAPAQRAKFSRQLTAAKAAR